MDELAGTGYSDEKKGIFYFLNDDDDDEGKKRDFLLKNAGWISLEVFLGVLWV